MTHSSLRESRPDNIDLSVYIRRGRDQLECPVFFLIIIISFSITLQPDTNPTLATLQLTQKSKASQQQTSPQQPSPSKWLSPLLPPLASLSSTAAQATTSECFRQRNNLCLKLTEISRDGSDDDEEDNKFRNYGRSGYNK
jgi:hypothetical protein